MSNEMNSRVVSVSTIKNSVGLISAQEELKNPQNWITIKWFHPDEYETQEQLNDAAENFAIEILKGLSRYHFIQVEDLKREEDGKGHIKGFSFKTAVIHHKTTI